MTISYIGIGSNLGNRSKNIARAIELLKKIEGIKVRNISSIYETDPVAPRSAAKQSHLGARLPRDNQPGGNPAESRAKRGERSEWVGGPPQGKFLNGVVKIETFLSPLELLRHLQEIEKAIGRKPSKVRWGPREIDLDILLYGDEKIDEPDLKIPHPEMKKRNFVLKPLSEIINDRDKLNTERRDEGI